MRSLPAPAATAPSLILIRSLTCLAPTDCTCPACKPTQAHNQADITFAQNMIPHPQAVQMSDIILGKQAIDPRAVQLANQIKAAQGPEIQQIHG